MKKIRISAKYVVICICLLVIVVYTIWDNNRIVMREQDIVVEDLPQELNDFTILQISDLHEKEFGRNQEKLINLINSVDYDVIVFTGDMLQDPSNRNYEKFYTLLDGIENKTYAYFVPGNTDPSSYRSGVTLEKSDFINGMEMRGITLLDSIDTIPIGNSHVHFTYFELAISSQVELEDIERITTNLPSSNLEPQVLINYYRHLLEKVHIQMNEKRKPDLFISLNHFPIIDERMDMIWESSDMVWQDFDLIIAGHYHGGQIRLPFIGAIFVPESYSTGLFPPKDRVKGLWEYRGIKQYVSTGLGSSDAIPFLNFRFLNPPEINVLRFKMD